jgi:hypothetical protein
MEATKRKEKEKEKSHGGHQKKKIKKKEPWRPPKIKKRGATLLFFYSTLVLQKVSTRTSVL